MNDGPNIFTNGAASTFSLFIRVFYWIKRRSVLFIVNTQILYFYRIKIVDFVGNRYERKQKKKTKKININPQILPKGRKSNQSVHLIKFINETKEWSSKCLKPPLNWPQHTDTPHTLTQPPYRCTVHPNQPGQWTVQVFRNPNWLPWENTRKWIHFVVWWRGQKNNNNNNNKKAKTKRPENTFFCQHVDIYNTFCHLPTHFVCVARCWVFFFNFF